LAKLHGLERGMLRRWVKWFNTHGDEAFKKKFTRREAPQKCVRN
jgi:transposase-like protein